MCSRFTGPQELRAALVVLTFFCLDSNEFSYFLNCSTRFAVVPTDVCCWEANPVRYRPIIAARSLVIVLNIGNYHFSLSDSTILEQLPLEWSHSSISL